VVGWSRDHGITMMQNEKRNRTAATRSPQGHK